MKILHVTHHAACRTNIEKICSLLGHTLETQWASWNYNVGISLAHHLWSEYKSYYDKFDVIITSDTAPLSRIFLQGGFRGKLIIWVCNRFDYVDRDTNRCGFPKDGYYSIIEHATTKKNVKIYSSSRLEHIYAREERGIEIGTKVLQPYLYMDAGDDSPFPASYDKSKTFLIPNRANEIDFIDVQTKCNELGIIACRTGWPGTAGLKDIRGIIHIPYSWFTFFLFENLSLGNVFFVPDKELFTEFIHSPGFWVQNPRQCLDHMDDMEWFQDEKKDLFAHFSSWENLKELTLNDEFIFQKKEIVKAFVPEYNKRILAEWDSAFRDWEE